MKIAGTVLLALGLLPAAAFAAERAAVDLAAVERKIAKEPAYQGKPKYCLLVFGPQAKHRVWVVLDGDVLYVDRNGNGDLTEDAEKVTGKKTGRPPNPESALNFEKIDIREGALRHRLHVYLMSLESHAELDKNVREHLAKNPQAFGCLITIELDRPGAVDLEGRLLQSAGLSDLEGYLMFANRPEAAPILHFGGPWRLLPGERPRWTPGKEFELVLRLSTPGLGAGTTVITGYENLLPEEFHPQIEITYPVRPGGKPISQNLTLEKRC